MASSPKVIVVSAADDKYLVVASDLFASIRAQTFDFDIDCGLLDTGLGDAGRQHFLGQGVRIEKTTADIDFPNREAWEAKKPGFRTLTARLFMRRYFPAYDVYVWMDADTWVQTPEALNTMIASAAQNQAIHIACELDRCYSAFFESANMWHIYRNWYLANYGNAIADAMIMKPMLNAGVWAMAKDAPVWDAWAALYTQALHRLEDATDTSFMADQLALNILLYMQKLPHIIMPASFNWLTYYAWPKLDRATNLYVEPAPPHRAISQFHLTRPRKLQVEKIQCLDGSIIERSLMYSARFM